MSIIELCYNFYKIDKHSSKKRDILKSQVNENISRSIKVKKSTRKGKVNNIRLFSIMLLMFLGAGLFGCLENFTGTRIGFSFYTRENTDILVAASSEQREFDVSDVMLDFHFGWNGLVFDRSLENGVLDFGNPEQGVTIGVALYFVNSNISPNFFRESEFLDYKNRDNAAFIRLIELDEFGTIQYRAEQSRRTGRIFNHSEELLIPIEQLNIYPMFRGGMITFVVSFIGYCEIRNIYFASWGSWMEMSYRFINETIIEFTNRR